MLHGGRRSVSLALAAALWALASAPAVASAQPRRVVIVNLAADQDAGAAAATRLRRALEARPALAALPTGDLTRAFEAALGPGPKTRALAEARSAIDAALDAFDSFDAERAASELSRARSRLLSLRPSAEANLLLAEIAFQSARLDLRAGDRSLAERELELAARLGPDRPALDPVRYPPALVRLDARARARASAAPSARLTVSAAFDGAPVFVDGHRVGQTPVTVELGAGLHYLVIAATELEIASTRLGLDAGDEREVHLDLTPQSRAARAEALRHRALAAGRDSARDLARAATDLAGVDAAFVLVGAAPSVAAYDRRDDHLSYRRPVDAEVERMFGLLEPVGMPALVTDTSRDEPPWYRRSWGLAAIGSGVVAAVLGAAVIASSDGDAGGRTYGWDGPPP